MKKKLKFSAFIIAFLLLSCEKDLYQKGTSNTTFKIQAEKKYVSIKDVPELIPVLQDYNSAYNYLSTGESMPNRSAEELDLGLEHIIKLTDANGKDSYSIVIKDDSEEFGKTFFENLHIMEKDGVLKAFILKYTAVNDYISTNLKTFSGDIEIYDKDRNFEGMVRFENGAKYCEKITIGCWTIIIFSDGNLGVRNDCEGGGSGGGSDGGSSGGGDGGDGSGGIGIGYGYGYGSGGGGSSSNPPDPSDPTLVHHTIVAPNTPVTTFQMANKLYAWLDVSDLSLRNWLRNSVVFVDDVAYLVLDEMGNELPTTGASDKEFFRQAISAVRQGGQADFVKKIIVDPTFQNNPCLSSVYTNLKNCPAFNSYIQSFDGNFSVANLKLQSSSTLAPNTNATTSPPSNYLITITFNTNNLARPGLSIARTFIHELIHAEIFRKLLSCAGMPNLNFSGYTDAQWRNFIITLKDDYPGLYDYYLRYAFNIPAGQQASDEQHELMAQHYREQIVQVLKQYNNTLPEATYQAIAWEGLKGTVAWNHLSPTQKAAINATISSFNSSNTNCQ